jgi:hypothetical protein
MPDQIPITITVIDAADPSMQRHWMHYRDVLEKPLPEGLPNSTRHHLQSLFMKAWEAARDEGFKSGVEFSARTYGRHASKPTTPGLS